MGPKVFDLKLSRSIASIKLCEFVISIILCNPECTVHYSHACKNPAETQSLLNFSGTWVGADKSGLQILSVYLQNSTKVVMHNLLYGSGLTFGCMFDIGPATFSLFSIFQWSAHFTGGDARTKTRSDLNFPLVTIYWCTDLIQDSFMVHLLNDYGKLSTAFE